MLSKKSLIVLIALVFCICISHTSAKVVHLTGDSFDRSVNDGKAWFVEFFAPWCGHCKRLEPTWELISEQLEGEVVVASVDATVEKQLARRFNINGFPSLLFFKDGYYYTFHGADREPNTLTQFARAGYKQAEVTRLPQDNWFEPYLAQMVPCFPHYFLYLFFRSATLMIFSISCRHVSWLD